MSQLAIITDLNRCVGCMACSAACKTANGVRVGDFWIRVLRVGPNKCGDYQGRRPNIEMNFLPLQCQHCIDAPCVTACPTGASFKREDGTVQIEAEACIGCLACMDACPYGVRTFNDDAGVVEKCTLCRDLIDNGELPQCVAQCSGRARWFGDLDEGLESFVGPGDPASQGLGVSYEDVHNAREHMLEYVEPFEDDELYALPDTGNGPAPRYILRGREWKVETVL